jgi:hypothetical protein
LHSCSILHLLGSERDELKLSLHSIICEARTGRMSYAACVCTLVLGLCSCHSSKYKYLQQDNTQIRVDEHSGRTDRLTDNGWIPISFDRPATHVPDDQLKHVSASLVEKDIFDRIAIANSCYTIDNDSEFVIKELWVSLPATETTKDKIPLLIPLESESGGFSPVGSKFVMCYHGSRVELNWDPHGASVPSATGWKQE